MINLFLVCPEILSVLATVINEVHMIKLFTNASQYSIQQKINIEDARAFVCVCGEVYQDGAVHDSGLKLSLKYSLDVMSA